MLQTHLGKVRRSARACHNEARNARYQDVKISLQPVTKQGTMSKDHLNLYPEIDESLSNATAQVASYGLACLNFATEQLPAPILRLRVPTWSGYWAAFGLVPPQELFDPGKDRGYFERHWVKEIAKRSKRGLYRVIAEAVRFSPPDTERLYAVREQQMKEIRHAVEYYENIALRYKTSLRGGDAIKVQDFINAWQFDILPPED